MNILLIDDHPLVLEILGAAVERHIRGARVIVAGSLDDGVAKGTAAGALDLVMLDLGFRNCADVSAVTRIRRAFPDVPLLVVSAHEDRSTVLAAFRAGAQGYVPKTAKPFIITTAAQLVVAGERYLPAEILGGGTEDGNARPNLTDRQLSVLRLIAKGCSNKEIAARLSISEGTVKEHVQLLCRTLDVSNRAHAVAAALRLGIALD